MEIGPEMKPYDFSYLDDILVPGDSFWNHLQNLQELCNWLRKANLQVNNKNATFAKKN